MDAVDSQGDAEFASSSFSPCEQLEKEFLSDVILVEALAGAAAVSASPDFCLYLDAAAAHLTSSYFRCSQQDCFVSVHAMDDLFGDEAADEQELRRKAEPEEVQGEPEKDRHELEHDDAPAVADGRMIIDADRSRAAEEQAQQPRKPVEVVQEKDLRREDPATVREDEHHKEVLRLLEFHIGYTRALEKNLVIDVDHLGDVKHENDRLPRLQEPRQEHWSIKRDGELRDEAKMASTKKRNRKSPEADAALVEALRRRNDSPEFPVTARGIPIGEADVYETHPATLLTRSRHGTRLFFSTVKYSFRPSRSRTLLEGSRWKQQGPSLPIKIHDEIVAYKTYLSFMPFKRDTISSPTPCASNLAGFVYAARPQGLSRYTMEEIVLREDREMEKRMLELGRIPRPFRVLCRISARWPGQ